MQRINQSLMDNLCKEAAVSKRRRAIYCFHQKDKDKLQRMLNAMQPDTYIRPHRHITPIKREVFIALQGKALVVEFNNKGNVLKHIIIGKGEVDLGMEITEGAWHSIIALETDTVVYEVKDGPYIAEKIKNLQVGRPLKRMRKDMHTIRK